MLRYICALAAVLAFGMIQEAPAGGCAGAGCGCAPAVVLAPPCPPLVQSYLVNQGPALSGPGHYLGQFEDGRPAATPMSATSTAVIPTACLGRAATRAGSIIRIWAIPMPMDRSSDTVMVRVTLRGRPIAARTLSCADW